MAIKSCRDKRTADFLAGKRVAAFEQCARRATVALTKLQAASQLIDLRNPPSNNFEALAGEAGRYSIRIDRKWRVCFGWQPHEAPAEGADALATLGDAIEVEITNHYD